MQMVYLNEKNLNLITSNNQIYKKKTEKSERLDFKRFLKGFSLLCLKRKTSKFNWYFNALKTQMKAAKITTVKQILESINKLNDNEGNNIQFSKLQVQVIEQLGMKWNDYNKISKLPAIQQHCHSLESKNIFTSTEEKAVPVVDMVNFFSNNNNNNNSNSNGISENVWLGDSGASCHMTNNDAAMFDCTSIKSEVWYSCRKNWKNPSQGNTNRW